MVVIIHYSTSDEPPPTAESPASRSSVLSASSFPDLRSLIDLLLTISQIARSRRETARDSYRSSLANSGNALRTVSCPFRLLGWHRRQIVRCSRGASNSFLLRSCCLLRILLFGHNGAFDSDLSRRFSSFRVWVFCRSSPVWVRSAKFSHLGSFCQPEPTALFLQRWNLPARTLA